MNLRRHRYRAWIVPYAEGTLDAGRRAKLEAWLARDPVLAAEAEAERRVVARLRDAAAQSSGRAPGEKDLWPGIASRLEPRRSPVRPLILVGGLSAAATSLAWATLWGPLGHPAPPPPVVMVSNPGAPGVIVVGPPSARRHGHSGRRPRHGGGHVGRAPFAPRLRPSGVTPGGSQGAQDDGLLARGGVPPAEGGDGTPSVPEAGPGAASRFHLATEVRPAGTQDAAPAGGGAGHDDAPTGDAGPAPAPDDAAGLIPGTAPEQQAPTGRVARRRPSGRHHRRHARRARQAAPGADRPAPAAAPETAAPLAADTRPGVKGKPVD